MTTDTTVNKQRTFIGILVSNIIIAYTLIDTSVDFATVKNSLDFNNAYFCCWDQNMGGGWPTFGGGAVPPAST